jgi:serine/threonine protein kinase
LGPLFVTPLITPGSLDRLIKAGDPGLDDPTNQSKIILGIVQGMRFLHSQKPPVMHRDLKPGNILVDKDMKVRICDFGSSRTIEADVTQTGGVGSPAYCAPEVFDDSGRYGTEVDVFSFGLTWYEILTGERVIKGPSHVKCYNEAKSEDRPEIPANLNPELSNLFACCWSPHPGERPSFDDIFADLASEQWIIVQGADSARLSEYVKATRIEAHKMAAASK